VVWRFTFGSDQTVDGIAKAKRSGIKLELARPGKVGGSCKNGTFFFCDYAVYSIKEFLETYKTSHESMNVSVITQKNQELNMETLVVVRTPGPRMLRLFTEESTDFSEDLLPFELREGHARDKHKALIEADVLSRELPLREGQRLSVMNLKELKEAAEKREEERLLKEIPGAGNVDGSGFELHPTRWEQCSNPIFGI